MMRLSRRHLWMRAFRTGVFLLVVCVLFAPERALPAPPAVATVVAVRGELMVLRRGTNAAQGLALRGALYEGDIVRTGPGGRAELVFRDGTPVKLGGGTRIVILPDPGGRGGQDLFRALAGVVWSKLRRGHQIQAPAANIIVPGTEIVLAVSEDDGATTLTVVEGAVVFFNASGTVEVRTLQQSMARIGQAPTPPVAVDVSGLVAWTADIAGLPMEFELPFLSPDPAALQTALVQRAALVRADPRNAGAQVRLGEVLYDLGDYQAASSAFEAATYLRPGDAANYLGLGRARLGQGDAPGAVAAFERAQELAPGGAAAPVGLGLAHLARGDYSRARAVLEPVRGQALAQAVLGLIDLYGGGETASAAGHLQSALAQEPRLYQAQSLLALAYLTQNRLPEAEQAARAAARLQPNSAQTQGILATVLFFARRPEEATRAARRAATLNPLSAFAQFTEGRVLLAQQRTEEARAAYGRAAALAPNLWIIHVELGAVYLRLDRASQASAAYRRGLALNPKSAEAHTGLGVALQRQGRFAEAEAEHRQALALDPNSATARGNLAALAIERGGFDQATEQLERGILAQPDRGILYARLAELSLYRQNLFAAQEFARRAVGLLPASAIAHYQLGRVYLEQERIVQAEQQFRQAATLDPQFADARFALGLLRERAETGLLPPLAGAASPTLGSASATLSLQNLQTPGAEERIQAALQDPAVVRIASRSYGDTQLDGRLGGQDARDFVFSHLREGGERRGVLGLTAQRQETDGVRSNADQTLERFSATFGQKAGDNASGVFLLAESERRDRGLNVLEEALSGLEAQRSRVRVPRFLAGFHLQPDGRRRTRALLQYSRPRQTLENLSDADDRAQLDFDSLNAEVRHDLWTGNRHWLSAGLSTGARRLSQERVLPAFPPYAPTRTRSLGTTEVRAYGGYLRDELALGERLRLTGEIRVQNLSRSTTRRALEPEETPAAATATGATAWLPNLILAYLPDARSGLRFRARRVFGEIQDFQILAPTDVFLFSLTELPKPALLRQGTSYELEYDRTFRDASFLRVGLFHLRLPEAVDGAGVSVRGAHASGVRAGYEGILSRDATLFVNLSLNGTRGMYEMFDSEGTALSEQRIADLPRWSGQVGVHYLNRRGWFVQPSLSLLGSRIGVREGRDSDPARRAGLQLVNLRAGRRWGLRSTAFVEIANVLDQRYVLNDALQPGCLVRLGVTQRF